MPSNNARKAKNSKAENPDRPARETIKGLPEHAQYQKQGEVFPRVAIPSLYESV